MDNVIELRNICKSFYGIQVLKNINIDVRSGEALCIAGENGSGKSTMIKIISGAFSFDCGTIKINGKEYKSITPSQSMSEGIQVIYQDFSLFPNLSVAENIGLSYHMLEKKKGFNLKMSKDIARRSLSKIDVEMDLEMLVEDLSVAEKQIVAIARAIMQDAKLIIMDEPTTTLTQKEIAKLYEIIISLKKAGVAIIFVSHKLDEIFAVCDRIFVIRNGEEVANFSVDEFERDKLPFYMTGSHITEEKFIPTEIGRNIFEVNNLSCKEYFSDISFKVRHGEIVSITGRLGSGRTEMAKALFGVLPITGGDIFLKGNKIRVNNVSAAIKNRIGYIPDDRLSEGLFLESAISENLVAVIVQRLKNKIGILNLKSKTKASKVWLEKLAIKATLNDAAKSLSGGNQQRVVLAKWMASHPELLVLNCPTVGVDVKSKSEIHAMIKEMVKQGMAVLLISDDIGEILNNSNRVLVMNGGRITFEADTKDLTYNSLSEKITESAF